MPRPRYNPPAVTQALQDIETLGWWNLLLGRIPTSLAPLQTNYMETRDTKGNGKTWTSAFITQLWKISFEMWEHRNNAVHGEKLTQVQQAELEGLRQQVRDQFAQGPEGMVEAERYQLDDEHKEWALSLSITKTKLWLESITLSREAFQAQSLARNHATVRQQQLLGNWLQTANTTPAMNQNNNNTNNDTNNNAQQ